MAAIGLRYLRCEPRPEGDRVLGEARRRAQRFHVDAGLELSGPEVAIDRPGQVLVEPEAQEEVVPRDVIRRRDLARAADGRDACRRHRSSRSLRGARGVPSAAWDPCSDAAFRASSSRRCMSGSSGIERRVVCAMWARAASAGSSPSSAPSRRRTYPRPGPRPSPVPRRRRRSPRGTASPGARRRRGSSGAPPSSGPRPRARTPPPRRLSSRGRARCPSACRPSARRGGSGPSSPRPSPGGRRKAGATSGAR